MSLLKASTGGGDLGVADRIYDMPPASPTFPYLKVGDDQVIGDDDDCGQVSKVVTRVHVWSQRGGKAEAKTIGGAVRDRIRGATWSLPGFSVDNVQFLQMPVLNDPDGISAHAIVEFEFLITHLA